jgi:hypothetical protein
MTPPSVVLIDIGAGRGRQQAADGGGSGSATEKQRCNKKRTVTTDAVPSDNKIVSLEPVGNNDKTATATDSKNLHGTAQLPPEPLSGRQGEDSVDSDNISSSVSLQPHKGGKHSGIFTVVYVIFFSHQKGLFTIMFINAGP